MEDKVQDGRVAERILNDPVFLRAVDAADDEFVAQWRSAYTVEEREAAWHAQQALDAVVAQLRVVMDRGTWEEAQGGD